MKTLTAEAKPEAPAASQDPTGQGVQSEENDSILETIQAEYEKAQQASAPEAKQAGTPTEGLDKLDPAKVHKAIETLEKLEKEKQQEAIKGAVDESVKKMKKVMKETDDAFDKVPDYVLEGVLRTRAEEDWRVALAFADRGKSPENWDAAVGKIAKDTAKDLASVLLAEGDAAKKRVRGAMMSAGSDVTLGDAQQESEKLANLPSHEFKKAMREKGIVF